MRNNCIEMKLLIMDGSMRNQINVVQEMNKREPYIQLVESKLFQAHGSQYGDFSNKQTKQSKSYCLNNSKSRYKKIVVH